MSDQAHTIGRFYGEPIAYAPQKVEILLDLISQGKMQPRAAASELQVTNRFNVRKAGVYVLEISGSLVNRVSFWEQSYEEIKAEIAGAIADPEVKGILLRVDSYGGEVDGMWDTLDFLRAAGKQKPIWAISDGAAYSAAFALFSQASKRFSTRTAGVGSVGVIAVHYDLSERLKILGAKPTVIKFGEKKDQFGPFKPLSEEAEAKLQASVDASGETFVRYVAESLGITEDAVRATQADVFDADQALDLKFIDAIATYEQVIAQMIETFKTKASVQFGGPAARSQQENNTMENPNPAATVDTAAIQAAARNRVKAILTSPEASGREALANHLAFDTEMTAEAAEGILKASAKAVAAVPTPAPEPKSQLATALGALADPGITATANDDEQNAETKRIADSRALYRQMNGIKQPNA